MTLSTSTDSLSIALPLVVGGADPVAATMLAFGLLCIIAAISFILYGQVDTQRKHFGRLIRRIPKA